MKNIKQQLSESFEDMKKYKFSDDEINALFIGLCMLQKDKVMQYALKVKPKTLTSLYDKMEDCCSFNAPQVAMQIKDKK